MENVFADFLQNGGLYETITVTEDNVMDFCSLLGGKIKISIFCPKCKENRVFTMKPVTFFKNLVKKYIIIMKFISHVKLYLVKKTRHGIGTPICRWTLQEF